MFWLKSCPRCDGDLYDARDLFGGYLACLQCGHYLNELEELAVGYTSWAVPEAELAESEVNEHGELVGLAEPAVFERVAL